MSAHHILHSCTLCMLVILSQAAQATTSSSLSAEAGADNNSGRNYYVSGKHNFSNRLQISAGAGKSQFTDTAGMQLDSKSYIVGIKSDPAALFSIGLDRSHAQQTGNLDIDSTILTLELNTLDWNAYISPESRDISLNTNINQQDYNFSSNGYLIGFGYYGWDPVYVSWSHSSHDYPSKITNFDSRPVLSNYVFGTDTVNQLFALEDWRNTFEIGYLFTNASIAFNHSSGRSAVDQSISIVNKIYYSYRLSSNWLMNTTLGRSYLDTNNTRTTFGSLGLTYKW